MRRWPYRALTLGVLATLAVACGGDDRPSRTVGAIANLEVELPAETMGLRAEKEDVLETFSAVERAYVDAVALYSFRDADDELQATLQISRFNDDARYQERDFRLALVNQLGATKPTPLRMDDATIWLSSGDRQSVAAWFSDRHLFVFSARDDFATPRSLLRTLLEVEL